MENSTFQKLWSYRHWWRGSNICTIDKSSLLYTWISSAHLLVTLRGIKRYPPSIAAAMHVLCCSYKFIAGLTPTLHLEVEFAVIDASAGKRDGTTSGTVNTLQLLHHDSFLSSEDIFVYFHFCLILSFQFQIQQFHELISYVQTLHKY